MANEELERLIDEYLRFDDSLIELVMIPVPAPLADGSPGTLSGADKDTLSSLVTEQQKYLEAQLKY